jgi:hypothetical protein
MTTGPSGVPVGARGLVNPYRNDGNGEVRGATLGRLGLAAGVIAVVVPSVDGAAAAGDVTEVWIGSGPVVAQEIGDHTPTAGYLWPADQPLPSPALNL